MIKYPGQLAFGTLCRNWTQEFLKTPSLMTGEWQSQDISDKPMLATRELLNVSFGYDIPLDKDTLAVETGANLPWAEDHFQERVSGEPLNPPPSNEWWPFAQKNNADHKDGEIFSHTYPERMWPKHAGGVPHVKEWLGHYGIRYHYGDLNDVVAQLRRGPLTRQAFLPIWFPEDTGAVDKQRVPCTIGYHFLIRDNQLQITYYIRSCDFVRHFRDDVYMASRLAQWVAREINVGRAQGDQVTATRMIMHIVSFHVFEGDVPMLQQRLKDADKLAQEERNKKLMGGWL